MVFYLIVKIYDNIFFRILNNSYYSFNFLYNYKYPRIQSNILFLPMTINKISYNKIDDMDNTANSVNVPSIPDAKDLYPQFNYIEDLLFVNTAKYLDTFTDPAIIIRTKPAGTAYADTDYAFQNANDNMMCKINKLYSFTGGPRTCATQANSHTVFVSPPINSTTKAYINLTSNAFPDQGSKEITIKFFVKFLGLTYLSNSDLTTFNSIANEFYFFKYGSALSIVIRQENASTLHLKLYNAANNLVATYENFQNRIGKWTFIVLSYSTYEADVNIKTYYPPKINWQVQNTVIQTIEGTYSNISITNLLTFTVPKEVTALWTRLMISYNYFTGFMGIYSSSGATTGLLYTTLKKNSQGDVLDIFKGTTEADCLSSSNFSLASVTYNCVDDYDFVIQEENNNYNCLYTGLDDTACFTTAKSNCPLGFFDNTSDICSCSNVDKKLMLISKNDNKNLCKSNQFTLIYSFILPSFYQNFSLQYFFINLIFNFFYTKFQKNFQ